MIAIIDYDAGNIKSVEKALHYLGEETTVTRDPQTLLNADKVILPGVGSFGQAFALLGENGVGKSSLIRSISDLQYRNKLRAWAELVHPDNPSQIAILSQNSLHLCYEKSVWEELTSSLPEYEKQAVFTILARLSFDENSSNKLIKDLSGGERFRVALAEVLLSKPEKRLIILDEPTNSLDLASLKATEQMLSQFSGAILVVSHDLEFLQQISVNRWIELTNDGLFELVNPPDY